MELWAIQWYLPETSLGGKRSATQFKLVHRQISNLKSWLLGTHRKTDQLARHGATSTRARARLSAWSLLVPQHGRRSWF